jgi:hypothetical protein
MDSNEQKTSACMDVPYISHQQTAIFLLSSRLQSINGLVSLRKKKGDQSDHELSPGASGPLVAGWSKGAQHQSPHYSFIA